MKIYIASDHAGFQLKQDLTTFLLQNNYEVYDRGPEKYQHDDDYPDYISRVAEAVSRDPKIKGIVAGYSGQGEAMVANRFPNVRCAVFYGGTKHTITLSREHNDANILAIGANFVTTTEAKEAVLLWLKTQFTEDERHVRRIKKIEKYD